MPLIYIRSLVISLAVVLTIIDLTLGFTLHNQRYSDMFADESNKFEKQHDVKRSNDYETTENTEIPAVVLEEEENRTIAVNASVIIAYPKDATELYKNNSTKATDLLPVTNGGNIVLNVNANNVSRLDWFEVTTSSAVTTTSKSENLTETRAVNSSMRNIRKNDNETVNNTMNNIFNNDNETVNNGTTNMHNDDNQTVEQTVQFENFTATLDLLKTMNATSPFLVTEDTTTVSITTEKYTSIPVFTPTEEPKSSEQTATSPSQIDLVSIIPSSTAANIVDSTTENNQITSIPRKKYSVIKRNGTANVTDFKSTSTKRVGDSINSHTIESRVTLKSDNVSTKMGEGKSIKITITTESPTKPMVSSTNGQTNEIVISPPTAISGNQLEMVSKRAGYLNHTKPMAEIITPVTEPESDSSAYEIDLLGNDRVDKRTSQSQLADDAIKEELLKESISMDEAVNTLMQNTLSPKSLETFDVLTRTQTDVPSLTGWEQKVEDELRVKPITQEKKNSILYNVNPNYKPLKKLEIQPLKPFTRDPDDNSWRNESLTSLGIVFNAKNSSKAFTEVLKNKTETVMNNLPDQNRTIEKIELRERLEKIAEKRKSKKKKTDSFGNIEYTDYEETNSGNESRTSKEAPMDIIPLSPKVLETTTNIISTMSLVTNPFENLFASTSKGKSPFRAPEYFESAEDEDYATMPKIDIKKTKTTSTTTSTTSTPRVRTMPVTQVMLDVAVPEKSFPERKPTVQYFPPRLRSSNVNYSDKLGNKINIYNINAPPQSPQMYTTTPKIERPTEETYPTKVDFRNDNVKYGPKGSGHRLPLVEEIEYRPLDNVYLTQPPKLVFENSYDNQDNVKGGLIIRHYKDFIDKAVKDTDYDRNAYLYTEAPFTGVTANDEKLSVKSAEYDYEQRKELLDRFVNNFNQNHERFKVDFPVLFNTSIVHKHGPDSGKVLASSSAMFKRLYNDATASKANGFLLNNKAYDPNCENITVELSPAYELHYYVPDQEEREEQRKITLPHLY